MSNYTDYFWVLDNKIPREDIEEYKEALLDKKSFSESKLAQLVELIDKNIPIPTQVYLTPLSVKPLKSKNVSKEYISHLSNVLDELEKATLKLFSGPERPLILTVTNEFSGTIRNIGINENNLTYLIHECGKAEAYRLYINFLESFSNLAMGAPFLDFRKTFEIPHERNEQNDKISELSEKQFLKLVKEYKALVSNSIQEKFPNASEEQLLITLRYMAQSCRMTKGDEVFIRTQILSSDDHQTLKGVVYTKNPFNGKKDLYGTYWTGPKSKKFYLETEDANDTDLSVKFPEVCSQLRNNIPKIANLFVDIMEVDFVTDLDGKTYFTSFNKADATARAVVMNAINLNQQGILSDIDTLKRIKPSDLELLLHPILNAESRQKLDFFRSSGVTASPGAVFGNVFFDMHEAMEFYDNEKENGESPSILLITDELLVSDVQGLGKIKGLITKSSGMASHAAVMARSNGIPCIIGLQNLVIDSEKNYIELDGKRIDKKTILTLEAAEIGRIYKGKGEIKELPHASGVIKDISVLVGKVLKEKQVPLSVMININNHIDTATGIAFGADGVGLCRTENMLTKKDAIKSLRHIIFNKDPFKSKNEFKLLEELQTEDFKKIFVELNEKPIKIRLMDMPLDELVPHNEQEFQELSSETNIKIDDLKALASSFKESNPMLGLRACRFGIITPQVYELQIRAILEAAYYTIKNKGIAVNPGIMFPLVLTKAELEILRNKVIQIEKEVRVKLAISYDEKMNVEIGTMLELPGAALAADELAEISEFFAFGTNDLTQTTLGISRNDSENYLPMYLEKGILKDDPFHQLHENVKELINIAVSRGRKIRKNAIFGICGEQGGGESALSFCLDNKIDYVSCSAFRILPTKLLLAHIFLDL